jgi:hypothetical protein
MDLLNIYTIQYYIIAHVPVLLKFLIGIGLFCTAVTFISWIVNKTHLKLYKTYFSISMFLIVIFSLWPTIQDIVVMNDINNQIMKQLQRQEEKKRLKRYMLKKETKNDKSNG